MGALAYLVRKRAKNAVLETLRKPGKLALWAFMAALLAFSAISSGLREPGGPGALPLFWFTGALFAFSAVIVVLMTLQALSGGTSIFDMNDVNLLFVSPENPRKTLLYGIAGASKVAFLSTFFILFQGGTLSAFGVGPRGLALTCLAFLLSVFALAVASVAIYGATNGRPRRQAAVKAALALLFAPVAVFLVLRLAAGGGPAAAVEAAAASPLLRLVPVAGWTAAAVTHAVAGEAAPAALYFGLDALLGAGACAFILLTNPDYYEDVLVATETAFEKKRALAEGNVAAAGATKRAVRVRGEAIAGEGARAIFRKHLREDFREYRFGFLSLASALVCLGAFAFEWFWRDMVMVLQVLCWAQIMLIGTGRGLKDAYSHYLYLIPEPSFRKIVWSNMEVMARVLVETLVIFGVGGALAQASPVSCAVCGLAYVLFSFLLLGVNYLSMRFLGADISAGLLIMIYYLAVVVIMAPGVIGAVVVGMVVGGDNALLAAMLVVCGWELLAGLGCFALSAGVLDDADMATINMQK